MAKVKVAFTEDDLVEDESHQVVSSLFMGPKAENTEWFKQRLIEIVEAQKDARLDYFPRDKRVITEDIQNSGAFRTQSKKMTNAIRQASALLAKHSIPFWSPRYQGHMCMEMAMPAQLGYFMTMLYNPNNVSIEASPLSTVAEIQVGKDLCELFGYNIDEENKDLPLAWGHITCDGTIANLEAVWVARNLKFYPLSIASAMKPGEDLHFIADRFKIKTCLGEEKLLTELKSWELLNLKSTDILDIPERLYQEFYISPGYLNDVMKKYGIQTTSKRKLEDEFKVKNGRLFCSNTKHYSWPKAGAIVGIGSEHVLGIAVDHGARVDLNDLRRQLDECLENEIPVYMVVAIIGSTEEGAVDPLAAILSIREEYQKKGLTFLVHGDGAWGGYFCTMIPRDFTPGTILRMPMGAVAAEGYVPDASLKPQTTEDLFALRFADSVTVDPHKAAYIPYPAGGLCYRDGRLRFLITWTSPYISRGEVSASSIGVFGVEGSKPGASVMSTWLANACIGLGPEGYGKLLGEVTFTCNRLSAEWASMSADEDIFKVVPLNELPSEKAEGSTEEKVKAERKRIHDLITEKTNRQIIEEDEHRPEEEKVMKLLSELGSDLNINVFSANFKLADGNWNEDVEEANYFNQLVIQDLSVDSPEDEPTKIPFYLTSTTFATHEYGECVQHFKKRLGLVQDDTDLLVFRNVVMSPWPTDGGFIKTLIKEYKRVMLGHIETCQKRNDTSAVQYEFLLQGTDKVYASLFPMFNLEKYRRQLIIEVKLPDNVMEKYLDEKKFDPEGIYTVRSKKPIQLLELIDGKKSFEADLRKRLHKRDVVKAGEEVYAYRTLIDEFDLGISSVVKAKSLRSRFRDRSYPKRFVPFYLYGTKKNLNIDHILVKSPNISLSADGVTLSPELLDKLKDEDLAKGCILIINHLSEAAMQPFQSTEGSMGDTLNSKSDFFFTPGHTFNVDVYEDPYSAFEDGPGLVDVSGEHEHSTESAKDTHGHAVNGTVKQNSNGVDVETTGVSKKEFKLIGTGGMTLNKGRYVDSMHINMDPYHIPEGSEKYTKWKKIFDSIGKELE